VERQIANHFLVVFRSLVERSINAWQSLNYVGTDKADTIIKHVDILKNVSSMDSLLETRQFWFFQLRESFMRQALFMKWDPSRLDEYILLPIDYGFANNRDCFFISHYWRTQHHPDPEAEDLCLNRQDIANLEWSYIWVDWTCMPQVPRSESQKRYFKRMLQFIPMIVRDCAFTWRFPRFEPRAWILFEVAEFIFNHTFRIPDTEDIRIFVSHLTEMVETGVKPVINKYGYKCTNESDSRLVIGWIEILVILSKIVPDVSQRQEIFDWINGPYVGSLSIPNLGTKIDKSKGLISCNKTIYEFTPVFSLTANT